MRAVAAIGAMKARVSMKKAKRRPLPDGKKEKKTASLIRVFREPVIPGRKTKNLTE